MRCLALHFDAPMMSWGTAGRLSVKDAGHRPTLSAVAGLIANALGRHRGDDLTDLDYEMVSRVDRAGTVERDFVTTGTQGLGIGTTPKDPGGRPSVSKQGKVGVRYYLADAAMVAVLGQREGTLDLEVVRKALLRPARTLYLGRRCYPMADPIVRGPVVEAESVAAALAEVPLAARHDPMVSITSASTDAAADLVFESPTGTRPGPRLSSTVAHPASDFPTPTEELLPCT